MREDGQIGSVKKAMEILRQISDAEDGVIGLKELAERAGVPKSTCVHILNTLCDGGYVQRMTTRGGYALGPMSYYIARNGKYQKRLVRLCHPVMTWLNRQTQQTVILSVLHDSDKYIVHYVSGERSLAQKGSILLGHIFETATGRAMFANLRPEQQKCLLARSGMPDVRQWPEASTPEDMQNTLARIRQQGFAEASTLIGNMVDMGIGGVIHDANGVVGAIGMALRYVPAGESMGERERQNYIQHLMRALREINHRLAFEDMQGASESKGEGFHGISREI